jgi:thiol-disulfide isomerase/thioredoxin
MSHYTNLASLSQFGYANTRAIPNEMNRDPNRGHEMNREHFSGTYQTPSLHFGKDVLDLSHLSPSALMTELKDKDLVLVFFAGWCGHCQALAPEYSAAGAALPGTFAAYDGDRHELPASFGVQGFPTIVRSSGGKFKRFSGPRTKQALLEFAQ